MHDGAQGDGQGSHGLHGDTQGPHGAPGIRNGSQGDGPQGLQGPQDSEHDPHPQGPHDVQQRLQASGQASGSHTGILDDVHGSHIF